MILAQHRRHIRHGSGKAVAVVEALLILGLFSVAGTAGPATAQTKIVALMTVKPKDVLGAWQFDLHAAAEPREVRMVETLNFNARGMGNWVMVPTDKTHETWSHKFTWFAGDGLIEISLAGVKSRIKAVASRDTMYAILTADRRAVMLTIEPGRVERYVRRGSR